MRGGRVFAGGGYGEAGVTGQPGHYYGSGASGCGVVSGDLIQLPNGDFIQYFTNTCNGERWTLYIHMGEPEEIGEPN